MAKRPSSSKIPIEEDEEELILEHADKVVNEEECEYQELEQYDDTNQEGPSCESRYMQSHLQYLQHANPQMSMKEICRKRPRTQISGFIDHTQARYYDRYKQQDYTRRNDFMKYCHVCRKKTTGKLRVLPGDLRLRKVWILRSNLDEERSAELWLRELACEGSHGGEFCEIHFPPGTVNMKGNQLLPLDVRPAEGRHTVEDDIRFDFDQIILNCVFCGRDGALSSMLPFIRNRAKRSRWIETLSAGSVEVKTRLTGLLKGGVTKFLCDYHIADASFEINGFGEWRLLRNALPDPRLVTSDKRGLRVYLVDKCRDEVFWEQGLWRKADSLNDDFEEGEEENVESDDILLGNEMTQFLDEGVQQPQQSEPLETIQQDKDIIEKNNEERASQPGCSSSTYPIDMKQTMLDVVEYSDDSDEENDMIMKMGDIPYSKRLCQVCSAVEPVGNELSMHFPFKFSIRTWPFDEYRHKKWLEIMDWPPEFEESMKTLWQKRKTEGSLSNTYHFCPINVCQSHLDYRQLPERMEEWHLSFCVLCDSCMSERSLLVPLPHDLETRQKWVDSLFPYDETSKFHIKKIHWLRKRLLRPKPTRYRICVYHFSRKAFVADSDDRMVLAADAVPLPMDSDDFDLTPRGPNSVCKCLLCDDWKKVEEMVNLRNPSSDAEKNFLIDTLILTEKVVVKKALGTLARVNRTALICNIHFPDNMDPFSIIAERRLMYGVNTGCLLCAHQNDCTFMIPFPGNYDGKLRTKWINSMCREPWIFRYLTSRLEKKGRHYLCASHFSRNSLRYHPGLGLWRKALATPVLACTTEAERGLVWSLSKQQPLYHPLILDEFDNDDFKPLDYDLVSSFLGKARMLEIENELLVHGSQEIPSTRDRRDRRKRNADMQGGRGFYADMPQIYGQDESAVEADGEVVEEECIVYEEDHHTDPGNVEVVEQEQLESRPIP